MDLVSVIVGLSDWGIDFGASVLQSEVGKMTLAFVIAERIHRRAVKKDVNAVVAAIDKLGAALGHRLDTLELRISKLETKE